MKLTGSQILLECLKEQGVDTIFGFPGGSVLYIYDALAQDGNIRHVLTAHEQGACHAADGYARSTGRPGVVLATSGPGATNLVTGLATAYMDSTPMVALTGNVTTALLGRDSFQEVDIVGITMPITKHNYQVRSVEKLAPTLREAFAVAASGRPGPVLVDIPKDITAKLCEYEPARPIPPTPPPTPSEREISDAVELIRNAHKPFLFAGGGVVRCRADGLLTRFAERICAPVACSLMGQGAISSEHRLFTGMIGMHGSKASNMGVTNCDLLIVVGARFSDRVIGRSDGFAPDAQVLHIDIDPAEVNKNVQAHHGIVGDLAVVLEALLARLPELRRPDWLAQIDRWKAEAPLAYGNGGLKPQYVIEQLTALANDDTIVVTDVGQHQMWTAQYYHFRRAGSLVTSGGLGTMGFGMGAAIGAKVGNPDRPVVLITGDGSFRMNLNELTTVARYGVPVKILLINNHTLGMVRQWQTLFYERRYSQTDLIENVNLCKVAEGFGLPTRRLTDRADVEDALTWLLQSPGPAFLECVVDHDEIVLPMVAPGDSIDRFVHAADIID